MKSLKRRYIFRLRNRSSILVITLWVLVVFSAMSIGLGSMVSSRIRLVKSVEARIIGPHLATAALLYAQAKRSTDKTTYDTLYELSMPIEKEVSRLKFSAKILDEGSKVNINILPAEALARLPGLNMELAQRISLCTHKPFKIKDELLLIEGVTPEIYEQFKDIVTTYSTGSVNINTASKEVLQVLGLDGATASAIEIFRNGPDGLEATRDDGVFESAAEISEKLNLSAPQKATLADLVTRGWLIVSSSNLELQVHTYLSDREGLRYEIILGQDRIKQWNEY